MWRLKDGGTPGMCVQGERGKSSLASVFESFAQPVWNVNGVSVLLAQKADFSSNH
jgi:hypothetical protein